MKSFTLVLLLVIGARAAVPMVTTGGASACLSASKLQPQEEEGPNLTSAPTIDPKLFAKRRYRSPLVLFSDKPPEAGPAGGQGAGPGGRARRRAESPLHESRGPLNVCESISLWVGNKTRATDIKGNEVTVLPDVKINNVNKKQFFFETICHSERAGRVGCRGIDGRHWNSLCTNSHTFVRALTTFQNLVGWRLIRINVACECVLSRKSWKH
ncbi:nerve growth factor [Osmerus eperlanus]|uniref:nerve growth factor n=1 Tax=Osmerus eperlanus TaxID=29151 RepID=UPI002E143FC4